MAKEKIEAETPDEDPTQDGDMEEVLRASAGKDRKITLVQKERDDALAQVDHLRGKVDSEESDLVVAARQLSEKIGRADALAESLQEREEALNYAIEHKTPINMTLGNAHRLGAFKAEVEELADSIAEGIRNGTRTVQTTGEPNTGKGRGAAHVLPQGSGLDMAAIKKMSRSEIALIPASVLERIHGK